MCLLAESIGKCIFVHHDYLFQCLGDALRFTRLGNHPSDAVGISGGPGSRSGGEFQVVAGQRMEVVDGGAAGAQ